jgi:sortase A
VTPALTATVTPQSNLSLPVLLEDSRDQSSQIEISKISIDAPINWDVPEANILESLKSGVAQYQGTSHPGEGGNVFIVGHSSNYFWVKSDYNRVFSLLDKLSPGDRIKIRKSGLVYNYDVVSSRVVSPEDVSVLGNTPKEVLTLMTCWPIGTSLNRLIVQAELFNIGGI